jgi:hypothetical protein
MSLLKIRLPLLPNPLRLLCLLIMLLNLLEVTPVEANPVEAAPLEFTPLEAAPVEAAPLEEHLSTHDNPSSQPPVINNLTPASPMTNDLEKMELLQSLLLVEGYSFFVKLKAS